MGRGMQIMCKIYGALDFNINGKKERFVWDYNTDEAINEKEMTKERHALSEKAKYELIKKQLENGIDT